jgi:RNA polymerase sigma-70 factor (ECF subfamily)
MQDLNGRTAELWERFHAGLAAQFRALGARDGEVDDLVQETFLRIQRGLASLRAEERLAAWIRSVARNVWHDEARRPRGAALDAEPEPAAAGGRETVEQTVAGWLAGFVAELPEPYREALRLSELEGLTQAECAARLGLSVSGMKSRVQRGRALLRARLLACCELEFGARGGLVGWRKRGSDRCGREGCGP